MKPIGSICALAIATAFAVYFAACISSAAQGQLEDNQRPPAKKVTDVSVCGYHLLQTWDEVKDGFPQAYEPNAYTEWGESFTRHGRWKFAGSMYACDVTLFMVAGLVKSIEVDAYGSGIEGDMELIFRKLVEFFERQGLTGGRIDDARDGETVMIWSVYRDNGTVWWIPGSKVVGAQWNLLNGMALSPITGALGLDFGTPLPDAMLSLPFGREDINVAEDGYASAFESEITATFYTPKSLWREVFGAEVSAEEDFTFKANFLNKKFEAAEAEFGFINSAYAQLQMLLARQYGPWHYDDSFGDKLSEWEDVFTHNTISLTMPEGRNARVIWQSSAYRRARDAATNYAP